MDENLKQRLLVSALVFNVAIIVYQVAFNWQFTFLRFLLGALIALVLAGIAYFGVQMSQR